MAFFLQETWECPACKYLIFRKTHQRALDGMQQALEAESRAKGEAQRMKKKLVGTK